MAEPIASLPVVLGVDACPRGWLAVGLQNGRLTILDAAPQTRLHDLIARHPDAAWIGIDIPIGLVDRRTRSADRRARELLGARRSSVFLTPPRSVLAEPDWQQANVRARALDGAGVSRQAHGLRARILEVAPLAAADPRLLEVHPELSFARMAGGSASAALASKHTAVGVLQRHDLLRRNGIDCAWRATLAQVATGSAALRRASVQDVLDAAAAAWTADRRRRGVAGCVPDPPTQHEDGRPIVIWT